MPAGTLGLHASCPMRAGSGAPRRASLPLAGIPLIHAEPSIMAAERERGLRMRRCMLSGGGDDARAESTCTVHRRCVNIGQRKVDRLQLALSESRRRARRGQTKVGTVRRSARAMMRCYVLVCGISCVRVKGRLCSAEGVLALDVMLNLILPRCSRVDARCMFGGAAYPGHGVRLNPDSADGRSAR